MVGGARHGVGGGVLWSDIMWWVGPDIGGGAVE